MDEAVGRAPRVGLVSPHHVHDQRRKTLEEFRPRGIGPLCREARKQPPDRLVDHLRRTGSMWILRIRRTGILCSSYSAFRAAVKPPRITSRVRSALWLLSSSLAPGSLYPVGRR